MSKTYEVILDRLGVNVCNHGDWIPLTCPSWDDLPLTDDGMREVLASYWHRPTLSYWLVPHQLLVDLGVIRER